MRSHTAIISIFQRIQRTINQSWRQDKFVSLNTKLQIKSLNLTQFDSQKRVLIEKDLNQQNEYEKMQDLFKQNGTVMTEESKLIYYLDNVTLNSDNMI